MVNIETILTRRASRSEASVEATPTATIAVEHRRALGAPPPALSPGTSLIAVKPAGSLGDVQVDREGRAAQLTRHLAVEQVGKKATKAAYAYACVYAYEVNPGDAWG